MPDSISPQLLQAKGFGSVDADSDKLVEECFQDHEAYHNALNHERFIITGRKGSGKTAIYRKLQSDVAYNRFVVAHSFDDYPWHHHQRQAIAGVPPESRYTHSWKYLILLSLAGVIVNDDETQPWDLRSRDYIPRLKKFLTDSYGTTKPSVNSLFQPGKKLKVNPTLSMPAAGVGVGVDLASVPLPELPAIIADVNEKVAEAMIECLNPSHDYHVCFDQLDLNFDSNDEDYKNRLTGLLLAARDLTLRSRREGKRFSVCVFLRDDIYESLRFEDKNKVHESCVSAIEWDSSKTKWTLRHLMERRLAATLHIPIDGAWSAVFDEDEEMRGRQSKYNHILQRTFRRPRDVIKYCNEVLKSYQSSDGSGKFTNEHVTLARDSYSQYLLHELDDEVFKHVPNFEEMLNCLRKIGSLKFTLNQFASAESGDVNPGSLEDAASSLEKLFGFSVIGFLRKGGGGGGSAYVWKYLDPRSTFDQDAAGYQVHHGFKEALSLKEGPAIRD